MPNYSFEDSVVCPSQPLFVSDSLPKPWYIPSNFQDGYYAHSCALGGMREYPIILPMDL